MFPRSRNSCHGRERGRFMIQLTVIKRPSSGALTAGSAVSLTECVSGPVWMKAYLWMVVGRRVCIIAAYREDSSGGPGATSVSNRCRHFTNRHGDSLRLGPRSSLLVIAELATGVTPWPWQRHVWWRSFAAVHRFGVSTLFRRESMNQGRRPLGSSRRAYRGARAKQCLKQ